MRNWVLFIFSVIVLFFGSKASAGELCSAKGYSVFTINGILNDEKAARSNKRALEDHFTGSFNNEKLTVDYLYNPTHLAGANDFIDVIQQGLFDQKSDYDLVEMLDDASRKVKTQKILLVAHSQGNFYANNFYDKVASQAGGVPSNSIGIYGVASPASRVAGGGKYLTSDTDNVIIRSAARFMKILPPNIHIALGGSDGNGHSFSDVYLKYQGNKIVSDIKASLGKLKNNDEQYSEYPCISPPELSLSHKIQGAILSVADPSANAAKSTIVASYKAGAYVRDVASSAGKAIGNVFYNTRLAIKNTFKGLSANVIESLPDASSLTTGAVNTANAEQDNPLPEQILEEQPKESEAETATPMVVTDLDKKENITPEAEGQGQEKGGTAMPEDKVHRSGGGGGGGSQEEEEELSPETPDTEEDTAPVDTIDTTPPVITILGNNPETVYVDGSYTDAGATALDDTDGELEVVTAGTVDTATIGIYDITYTATDLSENDAIATRVVNVVAAPLPAEEEILPTPSVSNILYSQPDSSVEISSPVGSFDAFTGKSGHIQGIKFAYNDAGNSAGKFIGVSVVDRTEGINYYGAEEGAEESCGSTYESTGSNSKVIVELDSSFHYKAYPCTGPDLVLDPSHTYGVALSPNNFVSNEIRFYGSSDTNDAVYLEVTDDSIPSSGKAVKSFKFPSLGAVGIINEEEHTIQISTPFGTNVTILEPVVKISGGASISPASGEPQDFTNPVSYTVTAENGDTEIYDVTVSVRPNVVYSQLDNSVEITGTGNISLQNLFNGAAGKITNLKFSYNDHGSGPDHFIGVQIIDQDTSKGYYAFKSGLSDVCADAYSSNSVNAPVIVELDSDYEYREHPCTGPNLILDPAHSYSVNLFRNRGGLPFNTQRFYGSSNSNDAAYLYIESDGIIPSAPASDPAPDQSELSGKSITSFNFSSLIPEVVGVIDEENHTISLAVPFNTEVGTLVPLITISERALINPNSNVAQDFSNPVTYTVTAEDSSTQNYIATVTTAPDPNPVIDPAEDTAAPEITSYTFNGEVGDVTINPLTNPLALALHASENVNWMSIKVENEADTSFYKIFQSGSGCEDGTDSCEKTWNGTLSSGGLLQDGTFRVKVHIADSAGNEFYDYLPNKITVDVP